MNVFIVEDEPLAVQKLSKLLLDVDATIRISGIADGIESAIEWLESHPEPDLILMDIELCDGQSFEIFNQFEVRSPVIFTTSYDEYAIQAFRVNSVDYLLKPIKKDDLERALQKYDRHNCEQNKVFDITKLVSELQRQNQPREHRSRFLVKQDQRLIPIESADIAYFFSDNGFTFLISRDCVKYRIDFTLDELDQQLDPKLFFRLNRQHISAIKSVTQIHNYINGNLKIDLKPPVEKDIIIPRERVSDFKKWLGK